MWQVHPGGLAGGGDHHEGLLQPDAACDCVCCGPLPGAALCAQSPSPAIRHCLHGDLHKVCVSHIHARTHTFILKENEKTFNPKCTF